MTLPKNVAVVGGGRMGAGIALTFAVNGSNVTTAQRPMPGLDLRTSPGKLWRRILPRPHSTYC